ncbi:MAG TPA: hypothetical protein VLW83_12340 [Candidatus Acidoferrales bacterium]|nr:hypothetical protein [Candidatus Acidoferrales bacterium]
METSARQVHGVHLDSKIDRHDRGHASPMIRILRETHTPPPALSSRISRVGGWNRFGQPNFRVVWGWSRLSWIGGKWTDRDSNGNILRESIELRRVPKYLPHDRWHIERWLPPETYGTPESWRALTLEREDGIAIPALGPYPSRGEYEHCFTLAGPRGEFVPLDPSACDKIIRAIEWARTQPARASRRSLNNREVRTDRQWDTRADAILDDAVPAFHAQPFVTVAAP